MATENKNNTVIATEASLRGTKQSVHHKEIASARLLRTSQQEPRNDVRTPKLRFKEFDGDWEIGILKKIASVNPKTRDIPNQFIYIDLESVTKGILIKEEKILKIDAPSRAQRVLDKNDILYQTVRPYQKNNYFFKKDGNYVASTGYAQIKSKGDSNYLFHFLHTDNFVNIVNRWSTGTSYPAISPSELVKIAINYPTIQEQQKIAIFLTAVDDKIQQLTKKKTLLEQYKKGAMQQIFSQQLRFKPDTNKQTVIANDSEAISNSKNTETFLKAETSFPDWEEKKLGEIGNIINGLTYSPNDLVDKENGILVLRSSNVQDGKLFFEDNKYVNVTTFNPVKINDILICVRNGSKRLIGKNAIINSKTEGVAFGAFMSIYRSNFNRYLFHYFSSHNYYKEVHKNLGATINSINGSDLKKFKIPFPSLKEQQKIANYLSAIDKKIENVQAQITKTQAFKKGLLQQMFV